MLRPLSTALCVFFHQVALGSMQNVDGGASNSRSRWGPACARVTSRNDTTRQSSTQSRIPQCAPGP